MKNSKGNIPKIEIKEYITGSITGENYISLGFLNVHKNINKIETKQPDYVGLVNLKDIGIFQIALWIHKKDVIVKEV